jgi:hypothetical protein
MKSDEIVRMALSLGCLAVRLRGTVSLRRAIGAFSGYLADRVLSNLTRR